MKFYKEKLEAIFEDNDYSPANYAKFVRRKANKLDYERTNGRRSKKIRSNSSKEIERLAKIYKSNSCRACGRKDKLTVDHIFPLSEGGSNKISNKQILCDPCNGRKESKLPGTNGWWPDGLFNSDREVVKKESWAP